MDPDYEWVAAQVAAGRQEFMARFLLSMYQAAERGFFAERTHSWKGFSTANHAPHETYSLSRPASSQNGQLCAPQLAEQGKSGH